MLAENLRSRIERQPRDVAGGLGQARSEAGANWIGTDEHDDRDYRRSLPGGSRFNVRTGHDDIDGKSSEFVNQAREPIKSACSQADFKVQVMAFDPAPLTQAIPQRLKDVRSRLGIGKRNDADTPVLRRLLRINGRHPKGETDSENNREPDPRHEHLGGGWVAGV